MESKTTFGWIIIGLGFFQILGLIANDLIQVKDPSELTSISFIAKTMIHISAVGTAAIGGRILPSSNKSGVL